MFNLVGLSILSVVGFVIWFIGFAFSVYLCVEFVLAIAAKVAQEQGDARLEGLNTKLKYVSNDEEQTRKLICAEVKEVEQVLIIRKAQWKRHMKRFIGSIVVVICLFGCLIGVVEFGAKKAFEPYQSNSSYNSSNDWNYH
ncbi:MAG: hypothetical protein Q4D51_10160 [Eubacteriales bacterium]|nr:hypothetical protein [Eubacteriales bacterium]